MRKTNSHANTNLLYIIFDILYSTLAFFIAMVIVNDNAVVIDYRYHLFGIIFMVAYIIMNGYHNIYNKTLFFYPDRIFKLVSESFVVTAGFSYLMLFVISESSISLRFYITFIIADYVLDLLSAFLTRTIIKKTRDNGERTLFVGNAKRYEPLFHFIERSNLGLNFIGFVSEEQTDADDDTEYIGSVDDLENLIHSHAIDQVFFMEHRERPVCLQNYVETCLRIGVLARVVVHPFKFGTAHSFVCSYGTYPVVTYHNVSLNKYAKAVKRLMDLVGSVVGLILASPIMLLTALLVKIDSPGPVIFKQKRVGQNGRHFYMYKFRSMCADAEERKTEVEGMNVMNSDRMFKAPDDPRVTRIGKIIRRLSIDELPQFVNVLKGEMSLVGTRPPTLDEVAKYDTEHWRRLSIRPGITGMWQVNGRSTIYNFEEVVALDTEYIDNWSIWLDLRILIKTVFLVFNRKSKAY